MGYGARSLPGEEVFLGERETSQLWGGSCGLSPLLYILKRGKWKMWGGKGGFLMEGGGKEIVNITTITLGWEKAQGPLRRSLKPYNHKDCGGT